MKNKPILVFDNDPAILIGFRKVLEKKNYYPITSSDPVGIINMISILKPRLVILDIEEEGLWDRKLLYQIKEKYPALPVIVMTSFSEIYNKKKCIQMGANDYLIKPFIVEEMIDKVNRLVSGNSL